MENLRANHFESRDSGLNKNEFNLSAKSGRSVGKGKLRAAKIIRVVTVPPVFAALLTTILYIARVTLRLQTGFTMRRLFFRSAFCLLFRMRCAR